MQNTQLRPDVVIGSALKKWCENVFPHLPRSSLPFAFTLENQECVCAFVDFVQEKELLESTYWLSSAYAQLLEKEHRKRLAMFFTPPTLTRRLIEDLSANGVDFADNSFCDPACGGGAFLAPIAIRMKEELLRKGATPHQIIDHISSKLLGFDKNNILCELSRHFLLMALYEEVVSTGIQPNFQIYHGDSLLKGVAFSGKVDVVVCNPPFRKMSKIETKEYMDDFSDVIEAQPNLYSLFFALCVKLLKKKGVCALITPTSFLSGQYFSKLRRFLLTQTKVLSIGIVSDRLGIFIDVSQETTLTIACRERARYTSSNETRVSVVSRDGNYIDIGMCALSDSGAAWPIPRIESDVALLKKASKSLVTLADYGYAVRIGAFVWNRDTRTTYASADSASKEHCGAIVPLLWSSDITQDGRLLFTGEQKTNNEHCFVNMVKKDHPSIVRKPCVILQRVTSNSQLRRLIAAAVPNTIFDSYGGFVGENHTVIIEQMVDDPALKPNQLAELLGTSTVDRYFRCISGATNVSIFELNQLHLPEPAKLRLHLSQGENMSDAARKAMDYM
ncbi:HsdM family class I SAM-dependent methyltransferase [Enterobacter cloacae]|uniref:HsdM family class I SAM-dependent methyltransferase n=1 Tax=Enterobacter cloacae TaxID=550 RepID=UPI00193D7672|nr:N-6 DNA methylase [Enterobacter cloacae]